ncbi:energy transducer TonB [Sphingomonas solaris]|uniref:Energy transducer TonB n=2 Tax=Alterirhizorhabdus solaris TaxID=2529389 RepID=A0A558QTI1_9SPHN|nr:energy transducer TonB [Sphingomonas solaris]
MDVAYGRSTVATGGEARFRASFPALVDAPPHVPPPAPAVRYGDQRRPNFTAIGTVLALHAVLLVGLVKADVIPLHRKAPPPLVVDLIAEPPAPPPPPSATPEPVVQQVQPPQPTIVSPPPLVATPAPPPQVAIVAEAPPPQAVVVAAAPRVAAVSAPVSVDLSTKLVSGKPPRYPIESRRHKEQGTVVLRLTLGLDGGVEAISVAQSSGFDRLDQAALDAVRRWRWSPTVQGGQPVQVRGMVPIPFVLQG